MASIRKIKKDINILTYDLLTRCYIEKYYDAGIQEEKFDEIIRKIVYLRNDLILRTNHPEANADAASLKEHYRKINQDLLILLDSIEELKAKKD